MTDGTVSAALRLSRLAHALFAGVGGADAFLREWPADGTLRHRQPRHLPVLRHLAAARALAVPETAPFVEALAQGAATLEWGQTYNAGDLGAAFLDLYGWTEFVGLRGPVPSEAIACGVLMLGPGAHYPLHAHAAEELYLPVAGTASWRKGEGEFVARPPGAPIHHPSFMPHAMRTEGEPLLALYLWRGGDLAAKSRLLRPA